VDWSRGNRLWWFDPFVQYWVYTGLQNRCTDVIFRERVYTEVCTNLSSFRSLQRISVAQIVLRMDEMTSLVTPKLLKVITMTSWFLYWLLLKKVKRKLNDCRSGHGWFHGVGHFREQSSFGQCRLYTELTNAVHRDYYSVQMWFIGYQQCNTFQNTLLTRGCS